MSMKSSFLSGVQEEIRMRGYSIRTEEVTRTFKLENICGLITLRGTGELLSIDEWKVLGSAYNLNLFNYI